MPNTSKQAKPKPPSLEEQFTILESKNRGDFDDNGWNSFTQQIADYGNDLYAGTRLECTTRVGSDRTLLYSGKDVERASMRLDFRRLLGRKRKLHFFQIAALIGSLLVGIFGNWAFSNFNEPLHSLLPWVLLILALCLTIFFYFIPVIKDMEP